MPAQFSIRIVGADTLQIGLGKFAHALGPVSRDATKEAMHRALVETLSGYTKPERGYRRTGNLFAGTNVVVEGYTVRLETAAYRRGRDYSTYVVGRGDGTGQSGVHAGYWTPARKAVDAEVERLTSGEMDDAIAAEIRKDGLA